VNDEHDTDQAESANQPRSQQSQPGSNPAASTTSMSTESNVTYRPLPPGVTKPDAVLSDWQVQMILSGLLLPNENAIYALAKEVAKARGIDD